MEKVDVVQISPKLMFSIELLNDFLLDALLDGVFDRFLYAHRLEITALAGYPQSFYNLFSLTLNREELEPFASLITYTKLTVAGEILLSELIAAVCEQQPEQIGTWARTILWPKVETLLTKFREVDAKGPNHLLLLSILRILKTNNARLFVDGSELNEFATIELKTSKSAPDDEDEEEM